jgi:DNA-binding NarL/FixJ family response regulator
VAGLERILEPEWEVGPGREPRGETPTRCALCCVDGMEGLPEKVGRLRESFPDVPILVFSVHLDLPLARAALQAGARGFIHAAMKPDQVRRAVGLASQGEVVAPRKLLEYLVDAEEPDDTDLLSARQREILGLVAEGLSNAEIAKRCYLSESTVKQHLRVAFKLLNVSNRIEAAALVRNGGL